MIPLVDTHCHLLAGLDDGPQTPQDAIQMCRIAWDQGTRAIAAVAHIGQQWPGVTPGRILDATRQLVAQLDRIGLPLAVFPAAEVMARPDLEDAWQRGDLLTMANRGSYLLIELPPRVLVDARELVSRVVALGVHPILAHPERDPELRRRAGAIEELIRLGCLIQVSAESIAHPPSRADARLLKRWLRQGLVHLVGSDGHRPTTRPPWMADAYNRIARWAGAAIANRVCSTNGLMVLEGLPLRRPSRTPSTARRFSPTRLLYRLSERQCH
jgi:protein-tyrosine phosphatase